jgi:hypothetical protein
MKEEVKWVLNRVILIGGDGGKWEGDAPVFNFGRVFHAGSTASLPRRKGAVPGKNEVDRAL